MTVDGNYSTTHKKIEGRLCSILEFWEEVKIFTQHDIHVDHRSRFRIG
jgi:hypothetical protein